MRIRHLLAIPALVLFTSCYQFDFTLQAGYAELGLDGDVGYDNGTGGVAFQEDIETGLGLGADQGTPYARAVMDFGTPVLAISAFSFEDDGRGVLTQDFGDISAGLSVLTDFELKSAKFSYLFEIPIGIGTIAPGIAVNYIDMSIFVRDTLGVASENVELQAPLPMGMARLEVDAIPGVQVSAEAGYIKVDVEDVEAELIDIEALVEVTALDPFNLFVGYRSILFDGAGEVDGDSVDVELGLSGFIIGGGVHF